MHAAPASRHVGRRPPFRLEARLRRWHQLDRDKKLWVYAAAGVTHVWLVDPLAQSLEVLRRAARAWTPVATHVGHDVANAEPFEALGVHLAPLWDDEAS